MEILCSPIASQPPRLILAHIVDLMIKWKSEDYRPGSGTVLSLMISIAGGVVFLHFGYMFTIVIPTLATATDTTARSKCDDASTVEAQNESPKDAASIEKSPALRRPFTILSARRALLRSYGRGVTYLPGAFWGTAYLATMELVRHITSIPFRHSFAAHTVAYITASVVLIPVRWQWTLTIVQHPTPSNVRIDHSTWNYQAFLLPTILYALAVSLISKVSAFYYDHFWAGPDPIITFANGNRWAEPLRGLSLVLLLLTQAPMTLPLLTTLTRFEVALLPSDLPTMVNVVRFEPAELEERRKLFEKYGAPCVWIVSATEVKRSDRVLQLYLKAFLPLATLFCMTVLA